jgi:hypothetical protein
MRRILIATSFFAFGMAFWFGSMASISAEVSRAAVPASLAFTAIGMVGCFAAAELKKHDERITRLEARVTALQHTVAERTTSSE